MKTTRFKLNILGALFLMLAFLMYTPDSVAQEQNQDTTQAVQDNSSAYNDSVQFDDMEPVFYEATDDDDQVADEKGTSYLLYIGIIVALLVVLFVLRRAAGRKKS